MGCTYSAPRLRSWANVLGHREDVALLSGWFGLVGEKRVWKLDFLRALCKAFEYDSGRTSAVRSVRQRLARNGSELITFSSTSVWRCTSPRTSLLLNTSSKKKS